MSKNTKGADGFKAVKGNPNASYTKSKPRPVTSVSIGGTHYEVSMLLDTAGKQTAIAEAKRGEAPTPILCHYFKNVGPDGNDCSKKMKCYNIHLVSHSAVIANNQRKTGDTVCGVYHQHDKLHIGVSKTNATSNGLADALRGLSDGELCKEVGHDTEVTEAPTKAPSRPKRVVIAIDPTGTMLRDDAFSCELVDIAQTEEGSTATTKKVLALTSYTPNFVDQGIEMKKLSPDVLGRASRLFVPHYIHTPVKLWGYWAEKVSFSTEHTTSAIAATKYYDVVIGKESGKQTVRVVGESTDQPEEPIYIEDVRLSHTIDYTTSNDLIGRSMTDASSITASEYFKLPSSGSRMEYALVLAGAVAGWCTKPDEDATLSTEEAATLAKGPAHVSATLAAVVCKAGVKLSISYRGYNELTSEPLGHNIVSVVGDQIGKMCYKIVDPKRVVCTARRFQPNEEQLRQLRAIAGMKEDDTSITYEDVAAKFLKLEEFGYAASDIERSIGCDLSEKHVPMSECSTEDWIRCTKPLQRFICCYNQFIILDAIDNDGPAAVARNKLLATLPPLPQLLVQWTAKRDSKSLTDFKSTTAISKCMASLAPHIVVPVKAIVVQPPCDGTITVYVPHATPPPCAKSQPVIITIPANCVRDKDGDRYNAFDVKRCAVGRTVMLMVSLYMMPQLTNGMTVPNDGSVTLVPEVPLEMMPPAFGRSITK